MVYREPAKRKAIRHAILESTRTTVIFLQLKQTSFSTYRVVKLFIVSFVYRTIEIGIAND